MTAHTTFRIGGPADLFIRIASIAELSQVLGVLSEEGIPRFILGGGANILVGDKGIRGAVLDLSELFWARCADGTLKAGAGISVDTLCLNALALELEGLENFYGMPGSLGGAIYMNARCYEKDFSELVGEVTVISPLGEIRRVQPLPGQWSYKCSPFQPGGQWAGWILGSASLKLGSGKAEGIAAIMRSRKLDRMAKGHYLLPSAGSVFKNNRAFGMPTGAILGSLGMKGTRVGDAAVSDWHANIFVNRGEASASDMRALIEMVRERTFSAYRFELEPEVLFIGDF